MNIQAVHLSQTIPFSRVISARYGEGKVGLPVERSQYLYSRFKHVVGVPSSSNNSGYSLSKLRAIDALIDLLGKFGKTEKHLPDIADISKSDLNQLLEKYSADVHQMAVQSSPLYRKPFAEPGTILNMLA